MFVQWSNDGTDASVGLGILLFQATGDCRHLRLRPFQRNTRLQSRDHLQIVISAFPGFRRVERNRDPKLISAPWKLETSRHHAYHRETFAVQIDRLPDNSRIGAKLSLPQTMAHNDHVICARPIFFRQKGAA